MSDNIAKKSVECTSKMLLNKIFGHKGKVEREAAWALFLGVVYSGSSLLTNIVKVSEFDNAFNKGSRTLKKGLQKISGWLMRYNFASDIQDYLWSSGIALLSRDTVIAVDSGDISKEFGGKGMEGMEMGYDASRGVTAMGHSLLCAAIVNKRRAHAFRLVLLKGRKGLPPAEILLFDDIVNAKVSWRVGAFPTGDTYRNVLVVASTFDNKTIYLYALNFAPQNATMSDLYQCAIKAANAYFCRWSVEVFFQDLKQCFSIEKAQVRKFKRLRNLLAICTLAYEYFAHILPESGEFARRILKTMKDSLGEIAERFRPYVANVRELLRMERTRYISGRPRKRKPPDLGPYLPGLEPLI